MTRLAAILALGALLVGTTPVAAQQAKLLKQVREGAPLEPLTAAELATLDDPLFRLVLKDHPDVVELDAVEALIRGSTGGRNLFVVDEHIINPALGQDRRAVSGFTGKNGGNELAPNVMLSFSFDANAVPPGFIEGWGWDGKAGRYNYYRLDQQDGESGATWKFRGSSTDADALSLDARKGTCFACHVNGGPVMKELLFPWNNWHSSRSTAPYLTPAGAGHWPIAESERFKDLKGAEDMERTFVLPAVRQFNLRRLDALIKGTDPAEITDCPRALRPLFVTTEYNAISAAEFSGLHPFGGGTNGPPVAVGVPDTFFLNANLIAGSAVPSYAGLGIVEARGFKNLLKLSPAEYKKLVTDAQTRLGGKLGDASFAWFVPETSDIDNHAIDLLIRRGVITPQFAAAALGVDLETPVFSPDRAELLRFVPKTFTFKPRANNEPPAAHPDELTKTVIEALKALHPDPSTPGGDFLRRLEAPDPVELLRRDVVAYQARVKNQLQAAATREAELQRLFAIMVARRRAAMNDPVLKRLNETRTDLFPVPTS